MSSDDELMQALKKKYKLSDEEHDRIQEEINHIMMADKKATEKPIAIIDLAPPGSGKTGLNGLGLKQLGGNAVIINNDELKHFHPHASQLAREYPDHYVAITNLESNAWNDTLFEEAAKRKYNIIFEGTGRNLKLLKRLMDQLQGYRTIVRGMAVNRYNCLMSIIERYEGQLMAKGHGRITPLETFDKAYNEMLENISQIEGTGMADTVEIYRRGELPSEPLKIYDSNNRRYSCAKEAVIVGRQSDLSNAIRYYKEKFSVDRTDEIGTDSSSIAVLLNEISNIQREEKSYE